jgi:hypothetical protein
MMMMRASPLLTDIARADSLTYWVDALDLKDSSSLGQLI